MNDVKKFSNFIILYVTVSAPSMTYRTGCLFSTVYSCFCFKEKVLIGVWVYLVFSILFHLLMFLFLCLYHTVLMTVAL